MLKSAHRLRSLSSRSSTWAALRRSASPIFRNRNPERAAFQRGAHVVEILDFGGGQSGNDCPATRADIDETLWLEPDECFTNGNVADPKGSSDFVLT